MKNPKAIFDAVRSIAGQLDRSDVDLLNRAIVAAEHGDELAKTSPRQIGAAGLALIKKWEGCKLTAYRDIVGVWTIGYGSTGPHVRPGLKLTEKQAEDLLQDDLDRFEAAVAEGAKTASQNEFDAFVALAFNIGVTAFKNSTALKRHKEGDKQGAAEALQWFNKAGGRKIKGLVNRRADEARFYLS
jgi:lysozyme